MASRGVPTAPSATIRVSRAWAVPKRNSVPEEMDDAGSLGGRQHGPSLRRVPGEGLLADHVLPGGHRFEHDVGVGVRRGGHGHHVDPGKSQGLGQRGGAERNAETFGSRNAVRSGSRPTRAWTVKPAARRARRWVRHPNPVPTTTAPISWPMLSPSYSTARSAKRGPCPS